MTEARKKIEKMRFIVRAIIVGLLCGLAAAAFMTEAWAILCILSWIRLGFTYSLSKLVLAMIPGLIGVGLVLATLKLIKWRNW